MEEEAERYEGKGSSPVVQDRRGEKTTVVYCIL